MDRGLRKGAQNGLEEGDALDLFGVWIRRSEDGVEDSSQVDCVNGRSKGRSDDRARLWETRLLVFGEGSRVTYGERERQSHIKKQYYIYPFRTPST